MIEMAWLFSTFKTILDTSISVSGFTFTYGNIIVFFGCVTIVCAFISRLSE